MKYFESIMFVFIYILMPVLIYIVPKSTIVPLVVIFLSLNLLSIFFYFKYLKFKNNFGPLFFTITFFVLGLISSYVKGGGCHVNWKDCLIQGISQSDFSRSFYRQIGNRKEENKQYQYRNAD